MIRKPAASPLTSRGDAWVYRVEDFYNLFAINDLRDLIICRQLVQITSNRQNWYKNWSRVDRVSQPP